MATVRGCPTDTQAMVEVDGKYATIPVDQAFPGVSSDRVFTPGMSVPGFFDQHARQLDIRAFLPEPRSRLAEIADGEVLWVRLDVTGSGNLHAVPYPGVRIRISADDNPGGQDGAIVPARAHWTPDGALTLSLTGISDTTTPRAALAIYPGGPPWLLPVSDTAAEPASEPVPAVAAIPAQHRPDEPAPQPMPSPQPVAAAVAARPTPMLLATRGRGDVRPPVPETMPAPVHSAPSASVRSMGLQLDAARAKTTQLETELRTAERRLRAADAENQLLQRDLTDQERDLTAREAELARLKLRLRKDIQEERRSGQRIGVHGGDLFLDPEEQFRFDVHLRWALRIPAAEKGDRPLRSYTLGPAFLDSLRSIQGVDHFKVVDVVVEVLTGLADTSTGRQMHALRVGLGGDDEALRRGEYTCWRIAIQRHTPQARRLHFWRSADDIELSRVVLHDDFTP